MTSCAIHLYPWHQPETPWAIFCLCGDALRCCQWCQVYQVYHFTLFICSAKATYMHGNTYCWIHMKSLYPSAHRQCFTTSFKTKIGMVTSLQMSTYAKTFAFAFIFKSVFHDSQLKEETQLRKQHVAEHRDLCPCVHHNLCFDACISSPSHLSIRYLQNYQQLISMRVEWKHPEGAFFKTCSHPSYAHLFLCFMHDLVLF